MSLIVSPYPSVYFPLQGSDITVTKVKTETAVISGARGPNSERINGKFLPLEYNGHNCRTIYGRSDDNDIVLFFNKDRKWTVARVVDMISNIDRAWAVRVDEEEIAIPEETTKWEVWMGNRWEGQKKFRVHVFQESASPEDDGSTGQGTVDGGDGELDGSSLVLSCL